MTCFICNKNEPYSKFYCIVCKKAEICYSCWNKWLSKEFICPFDKTTKFVLEITEANKDDFLGQEEYEFPQIINTHFCQHSNKLISGMKYPLEIIFLHFVPYFNHKFAETEFSWYFYIKTFYHMTILQSPYEQWVFALILDTLLFTHLMISEKHVRFFGGYKFINFVNKYFLFQIIITTDSDTLITFNKTLWCPKSINYISFETCIMKWLHKTFEYDNKIEYLNSPFNFEPPVNYLSKHKNITSLFICYTLKSIGIDMPEEIILKAKECSYHELYNI